MIYASYLTHTNATFNGSNLISFPKKGVFIKVRFYKYIRIALKKQNDVISKYIFLLNTCRER